MNQIVMDWVGAEFGGRLSVDRDFSTPMVMTGDRSRTVEGMVEVSEYGPTPCAVSPSV